MMVQNRLEDNLALYRTSLANERTLLAYFSTMLSFLALGAFLIKVISDKTYLLYGFISIIFGLVVFAIGLYRFVSFNWKIRKTRKKYDY